MSTESSSGRPVVVVTGAAGGMGSAIVADLARDRHVIAIGRSASSLAVFDGVQHVETRVLDLMDPASFDAVVGTIGRIDGLVHVAAVSVPFSVEQASLDDWNVHLVTNVIAPAELTRLALPALRTARGTVIFINSGAGARAVPGHAVYSASKFALTGLADALRGEEAENGVRVSTVSPGPTDTKMNDTEERSLLIRPQSVADAVRLVLDAGPDTQITQVAVRPRVEPGIGPA